jgi:hypothetical protein
MDGCLRRHRQRARLTDRTVREVVYLYKKTLPIDGKVLKVLEKTEVDPMSKPGQKIVAAILENYDDDLSPDEVVEAVEDYALDLKNFHEGSHTVPIVPVLVSTNAQSQPIPELNFADDLVASPVGTNKTDLGALSGGICTAQAFPAIEIDEWMAKGYKPTPTIVEAAQILYQTHSVADILRYDAGAKNLQ